MKKQYTKIAIVIVSTSFLMACSHVSPKYNTSATNVEEIHQIAKEATIRIGAGEFTAVEVGKKSIACRAEGSVGPADNKTFDQYIKDAIFDEIKIAGIYDEKSPVKLQGKLDFIDFSSNIGAGKWIMKMTFTSEGVEPFVVENTYPFSTNFIASVACEQVSQALPAATQEFIKKLIQHPSFRKMLNQKLPAN